jgi:hypothetical protein
MVGMSALVRETKALPGKFTLAIDLMVMME